MLPFIAVIIIGREIAISALREWMAKIGRSRSVAVSFLGKVKTTCQMVAIVLLLYHEQAARACRRPGARHAPDLHRRAAHAVVDGLLHAAGPAGILGGATKPARSTASCLDTPGRAPIIACWFRRGNSSVVEHNLAKVGVASSSLVSRSRLPGKSKRWRFAFPFSVFESSHRARVRAPVRWSDSAHSVSRVPAAPATVPSRNTPRRGGRVVMQRPAKPCTPVHNSMQASRKASRS